MTRRIELHIEELVLHGFDPHQRHAIGDAVRTELARLIEGGALHPDALDLTPKSFTLRAGAHAAGEGIAKSVHSALGGTRR